MKRFYKQVEVGKAAGGWQIALDARGLKTVKGSQQVVPSDALARAMAREWDAQGEELDTDLFVFRDMADYAIDIVSNERDTVIDKLLAYIETDTLCYRADPEDALFARQQQVWEPLLSGFEADYKVELVRISGIVHRPQNSETHATLRTHLEDLDAFALAGLETLASLSASLSIALMAGDRPQITDELWSAASLEEEWQAEQWGRDEEAEERRTRRTADFLRACAFAKLARG